MINTFSSLRVTITFTTYDAKFLNDYKIRTNFPDEDFCLYQNFPFEQLIVSLYDLHNHLELIDDSLTCTYLWLIQFYPIYANYSAHDQNRLLRDVVVNDDDDDDESFLGQERRCEFDKRLKLCRKSSVMWNLSIEEFDYKKKCS
jgi:hypothetical protein